MADMFSRIDLLSQTVAYGASADKAFYDNEPVGSESDILAFMSEISAYFRVYAEDLDNGLASGTGVVVELGAGSCGLASCVSRLANVKTVYAADISAVRMRNHLPHSVRCIGGDAQKIETIECDFNNRLPFGNESVDAILFDAALHHSRTIWGLLGECNRILRNGGALIAQRESYLSSFRASTQLGVLLESPEVAASVSENMYLLPQYQYYLKVSGFEVRFIRTSHSKLKRWLKPLNGVLFADGVLFSRKVRSL